MNCRICNTPLNDKSQLHEVAEMMYGTDDRFTYFKCPHCGCLQISEVPENLGSYYGNNYYSFAVRKKSALKRALRNQRIRMALKVGFLNKDNMKLLGGIPPYIEWLKLAKVDFESPILDVGSGAGELLYDLLEVGFSNLTGVDPFIAEEKADGNKLKLLKQELTSHDGKYDFIMFNHSLEHVEDQHGYLKKAKQLLSNNGTIMVRVPLVDSQAWDDYGVKWAQLDPPRHLYLHTKDSVHMMAEEAGLEIIYTLYDSTDFQFWASELYKQNKPLIGDDKQCLKSPKGLFPKDKIKEFKKRATLLNKEQRGDQAAFFLRNSRV